MEVVIRPLRSNEVEEAVLRPLRLDEAVEARIKPLRPRRDRRG
jgi:hypothetical protein